MADENTPSGQEENTGSNGTTPPVVTPDGETKPTVSPAEQARRDAQSEQDRKKAEETNGNEDNLNYLMAKQAERDRDALVKETLADTEKFPNVKPTDPMFKYAVSPEEVTEIATELQNRFKTMQQEALSSVQTESDLSLTDTEIAEREKELEKETRETGKSNFISYVSNLQRRKK